MLHIPRPQSVASDAADSMAALRRAATKEAHAKWEQLDEKEAARFNELAKGGSQGIQLGVLGFISAPRQQGSSYSITRAVGHSGPETQPG